MALKNLFFGFILFFAFLLPPVDSLKADPCAATWTEYKCESSACGGNILKRDCWQYCCEWKTECVENEEVYCWTYCVKCCKSCSYPLVYSTCNSWQTCQDGHYWSTSIPSCKCEGSCLEIPKNPRYYDNPNYPINPFNPEESKDPQNIYLPVKFDWDDVKGWKDGWKENKKIKTCSEECVQSYKIRVEETKKDSYSTKVDKSEYNYRQDQNAGACFLKSNFTHKWYVKACCNTDGTNCGPESNWQFKTNAAPEPIEPYDPDWNGKEKAENVPLPVTLKWCHVKKIDNQDVLSYNFLPLIAENKKNKCYPGRQINGVCGPFTLPSPPIKKSDQIEYIEYPDEISGLFTKLSSYTFEVAACKALLGTECSDYSQAWRFKTGQITLSEISWFSPPDGSTIGFPVILQWNRPWGVNSFQYELYKGTSLVTSGKTTDLSVNVTPKLELNKEYKWRVRVCWDYEAKGCEDWPKKWWYFKTTGAQPKLINPSSDAKDIPIPVNFDWEDVAGAHSYKYELSFDANFINILAWRVVEKSEITIDYPNLKQLTDYWWRVKTCADKDGEICGEGSSGKFKTFKLKGPENPSPKDGEEIFTYQMPKIFSWNSVPYAKYYKYIINYTSKSPEEVNDCPLGKIKEKVISDNSDLLSLNCLGKYQWQAQACLDKDCQEAGDWSSWSFILSQKEMPGKAGLVPCGRTYDDPKTPWNEREPCQIKHLFLLLRNILDFLFWTIGPIILVLLTIATAIIFYFSIGAPATIINVKALWKSAGIGYGIIFLAWLIINLFLAIIGYKFQIFGRWWEIKF